MSRVIAMQCLITNAEYHGVSECLGWEVEDACADESYDEQDRNYLLPDRPYQEEPDFTFEVGACSARIAPPVRMSAAALARRNKQWLRTRQKNRRIEARREWEYKKAAARHHRQMVRERNQVVAIIRRDGTLHRRRRAQRLIERLIVAWDRQIGGRPIPTSSITRRRCFVCVEEMRGIDLNLQFMGTVFTR